MFVQITKSSRQSGKTYLSYLVRESFRTADGPRSRTVCNISDLPPHTRDLIAASLKGQDFLASDQVQLHDALDYGGLRVLNDAWARFQLDQFFVDIGSSRQRGLLKAIIYSRLRQAVFESPSSRHVVGGRLRTGCEGIVSGGRSLQCDGSTQRPLGQFGKATLSTGLYPNCALSPL